MKTAVFMAVCMMALGEWGAPEAQLHAKEMRNQAIHGGDVFNTQKGVWAKDGSNFINIEDVDENGRLNGVHMYHFDKSLELTQITKARDALSRKDGWLLRDVNKVIITSEKTTTEQLPEEFYPSQLTAEKLGVVSVKPAAYGYYGRAYYYGCCNGDCVSLN